MADNVAITAGSGITVSTEEVTTLNGGAVSAQHIQRVVPATRTADGTAIDEAAGSGANSSSTKRVTIATDDTVAGALTETAPTTDTASSGLNGRLQRIAQRITSLIALIPTALGQGTMATSFRVVLPSDQASIPVAATLAAETTKVIGTVNVAAAQTIAATNAGIFATQATLQAGTAEIGKLAAGVAEIGNVKNSGTFAVQLATNTPLGTVAHDAADSGAPIKTGGYAINAERTAVANADRADFVTDLTGKQIVLPYANPENMVSGVITAPLTTIVSTKLLNAPAAGLRNYITTLVVSNTHATVGTELALYDGIAGATFFTVPAASVFGGAVVAFPTPLRQPTTATGVYAICILTGASVKVSAAGYTGV